MLVVIRCFNRMPPLVVETFEGMMNKHRRMLKS